MTGRSAGGAAIDDAYPGKPLCHIPGICSLALIVNLQNTDAAAGSTKELAQEGEITERDKVILPPADQRQRYYHQLLPPALRYSPFWGRQSPAGGHSCYSIYRRKPFARLINIEERRHPCARSPIMTRLRYVRMSWICLSMARTPRVYLYRHDQPVTQCGHGILSLFRR